MGEEEFSRVLAYLRAETTVDYVGLWEVISHVKMIAGSAADDLRPNTIAVVKVLLERPGVVAGQFRDRAFFIWDLSRDEVCGRIVSEWEELGREPGLGDIVWFTVPLEEVLH